MTDDRRERIRQRAHAIWEREGRPEGSHQQHWDAASAEIDAEDQQLADRVERLEEASVPSRDGLATEHVTGAAIASQDAVAPEKRRQTGKDTAGEDVHEPPVVALTGGAPNQTQKPMPDPFPARKTDAPGQAGMTPRPTDKPISGGSR